MPGFNLEKDRKSLVSDAYLAKWEAARQRRRAEDLSVEVRSLTLEVESLRSSLSWKITGPLRAIHNVWEATRRRTAARLRIQSDPFAWISKYNIAKGEDVILVDVSRIIHLKCSPGMRRVTQNIASSIAQETMSGAIPVDLRRGAIHDVRDHFLRARAPGAAGRKIHSFSKLLMLDASFGICHRLVPLFRKCAREGIEVISCVHDLIPLDHPAAFADGIAEDFRHWLDCAIEHSDAFVCVSESTARRLERELKSRQLGKSVAIGWWPLSSELSEVHGTELPRDTFTHPSRFCLCVGTLEPRKNHRFVLDAFSRMWKNGELDCDLVFAGSVGWKVEALVAEIENHPEFGRRLWWFKDLSDEQLRAAYTQCSAVIMASIAEGFGLPVIEGASSGKPVVLSNIPVFREIVIANGYFFDLGNEQAFVSAVRMALGEGARPTEVREVSWAHSAHTLLEMVRTGNYPIRLDRSVEPYLAQGHCDSFKT